MRDYATRDAVLGCLWDCQREAAEVDPGSAPRIGTREIELVGGCGRQGFRLLTTLRREGLISRGSGFCWLTEAGRESLGVSL